jgi:hypothetical protein
LRNGVEHMKMKFYIQGFHSKGNVHLEVRKVNFFLLYITFNYIKYIYLYIKNLIN